MRRPCSHPLGENAVVSVGFCRVKRCGSLVGQWREADSCCWPRIMAEIEMKTMSNDEDNAMQTHSSISKKSASPTCDEDDNIDHLAEDEEHKPPENKVIVCLRKASNHIAWDVIFILLTFYD